MLSLDKIEESILELERGDTCFSVCEKLAYLYIVRDHLKGYSMSPEAVLQLAGESEFLQSVNGSDPAAIMPIMDELMDAIHALHPRMYDAVMQKIRDKT